VAAKIFPSALGTLLDKPLLYNPYQQGFLAARRLRMCLQCQKVGSTGDDGLFVCPTCQRTYGAWTKDAGARPCVPPLRSLRRSPWRENVDRCVCRA
jgi:hypothetical protein